MTTLGRRQLLLGAGALAASVAGLGLHSQYGWLLVPLQAQPVTTVHRIGVLADTGAPSVAHFTDAIRDGLRELGYVERVNLIVEYRFTDGHAERLPELVAELLGQDVALILAYSQMPAQ